MLIHKAEAAPVVVLLKSQVCWARDRGSLLVVPLSKEPPPLMGGAAPDQALWAGSPFLRAEGSETLPLGWCLLARLFQFSGFFSQKLLGN